MLAMALEFISGGLPFLDIGKVADANAGDGLNLVALSQHCCDGQDLEKVSLSLLEGFRNKVAGFNVKSSFNETFD